MNIADLLDNTALFFPEKPAVIFEERVMTFKELLQSVNRLARGIKSLGLSHGDRAALFLPNIPEFAVVYYALQKLGVVSVSINAMLKSEEVKFILEDSGARILFTTQELAGEITGSNLPSLTHTILVDGSNDMEASLFSLMDDLTELYPSLAMDPDDPAAILYTSGTTGFPKGATLSHGNIISNANATLYHTKMNSDDVLHLFLPMFHCFGQNFIMNSGIKTGATIVLHRRFEPVSVLEALKKYKVTMFFAVPTIYIYLLSLKDSKIDISSLRYCFTAAANMPPDVAQRWKDTFNLTINDGYGLTESSPFASYNHDFRYMPGTIGSPIMNVEMKIADSEGRELPNNTWGEICIKGPNVMKGYWNRPEATAAAIKDGWFFTGDIGTRDDEGYYSIVDRVKDMINVAGNKVYPAEVENILYQHPSVHEAAVYGIPDAEKGESVKAAIVLNPDHTPDPSEIIEFCRSRIASFKAPKSVIFIKELPKSPTGKILKRILRENE